MKQPSLAATMLAFQHSSVTRTNDGAGGSISSRSFGPFQPLAWGDPSTASIASIAPTSLRAPPAFGRVEPTRRIRSIQTARFATTDTDGNESGDVLDDRSKQKKQQQQQNKVKQTAIPKQIDDEGFSPDGVESNAAATAEMKDATSGFSVPPNDLDSAAVSMEASASDRPQMNLDVNHLYAQMTDGIADQTGENPFDNGDDEDDDEDDYYDEFEQWMGLLDDQGLEVYDATLSDLGPDFDPDGSPAVPIDARMAIDQFATAVEDQDPNRSEYNYEDDDSDVFDDILELFPSQGSEGVDSTASADTASSAPLPDDQAAPLNTADQPLSATATVEETTTSISPSPFARIRTPPTAADLLELALKQEVVPAEAGVGSECLPGDFGFDPLNLAQRDFPRQVQQGLLMLLPAARWAEQDGKKKENNDGDNDEDSDNDNDNDEDSSLPAANVGPRPPALILRDYREAEIRHGRLAMLAAIIWPLQELLDRLLLDVDDVGPLLYGPVTLPYFPLFMTLMMMLLGYLDIYSQAIKDRDQIGEAFLPGDCFWDPLAILQGAPASMKRNMQERELFNGRVAMLAVAAFFFEEATTHLTLVDIEGNELLLTPAYTIPYIQEWLDQRFSPSFESMSDAPAMMASATTALTDAATAMMTMVATMIAMPPC